MKFKFAFFFLCFSLNLTFQQNYSPDNKIENYLEAYRIDSLSTSKYFVTTNVNRLKNIVFYNQNISDSNFIVEGDKYFILKNTNNSV